MIFLVIDGMGDLPIPELGDRTPLEIAETPNLDLLAREGETGLIYPIKEGVAPESDVAVLSILGYNPFEYYTGRGPLEAVGAGVPFHEGDLAVRCNFATVDPRGRIIDRRAGRDLTKGEGEALERALNGGVRIEGYPAHFIFKSTKGYRGVMVFYREDGPLSGEISNTDPAYSRMEGLGVVSEGKEERYIQPCLPLEDSEEARISAAILTEFLEKAGKILAEHEVNRRRIKEGKLAANTILTRDAGSSLPKLFPIGERYGVRFTFLAEMPVELGIAILAGMEATPLPPATGDFQRDCLQWAESLLKVLPSYDAFYIHIKGPDEPGHDGDARLKAWMLAQIDRYFLGTLLSNIDRRDYIICVTADHSTPCTLKRHSDNPVPLLISGDQVEGDENQSFSERECKKGRLGRIPHGFELMPKLMGLLKKDR